MGGARWSGRALKSYVNVRVGQWDPRGGDRPREAEVWGDRPACHTVLPRQHLTSLIMLGHDKGKFPVWLTHVKIQRGAKGSCVMIFI